MSPPQTRFSDLVLGFTSVISLQFIPTPLSRKLQQSIDDAKLKLLQQHADGRRLDSCLSNEPPMRKRTDERIPPR